MEIANKAVILECAASIVSAYVANNTIQKENLPTLIIDTFNSLAQADRAEPQVTELKPAVPINRSIKPDHIVCLENGKKFKSLKRHLMSDYNMTPQEYREKWGLPADYPMVAPNYALARSELAKKMGLGRREASVVVAEPVKAPAKRGKKAEAAKPAAKPAGKKAAGKRTAVSA